MTSGYIPSKDEPDLDEILAALGLGLFASGLTFVFINTVLDSWVARQTERMEEATAQGGHAAVGFAGRHADARGVRARPSAELHGDGSCFLLSFILGG